MVFVFAMLALIVGFVLFTVLSGSDSVDDSEDYNDTYDHESDLH